jgi:type II secretory pathway predicted ATPase ExeA
MYTSYFGLREEPFSLTPTSRLFYSNPVYAEAYTKLLDGIRERKGFMLLTGEVGTGKTTLLHRLVNELRADPTVRVSSSHYSTLTFEELLSFLCTDLGVGLNEKGHAREIEAFTEFLIARSRAGGTTVLLLDEAQDLEEEVLENLFAFWKLHLAREKLLQIVLVGQQPELEEKLQQPTLTQLNRSLAIQCRLEHLQPEEVNTFIHHRLLLVGGERRDLFSPAAIQMIALYSEGIPRLINLICDNALRATFEASQTTVSTKVLQEVVHNLRLEETEVAQPENQHGKTSARIEEDRVSSESGDESFQYTPWRSAWRKKKTLKLLPRAVKARIFGRLPRPVVWSGGAGVLVALLGLIVFTARLTTPEQDQTPQLAELDSHIQDLHPRSPDGQPVTHAKPAKSPSSSSPLPVSESQRVVRGKAVLQRLAERRPAVHPIVWGLATANPALALFIPGVEWGALSKEDQISLTWYLEGLIPAARAQPDQYIEEFRSAPGYETFRGRVADLCRDCWVIAVGRQMGDAQNLLFDKVIVQGNSLWEKADPDNRGVRASEFRGAWTDAG